MLTSETGKNPTTDLNSKTIKTEIFVKKKGFYL